MGLSTRAMVLFLSALAAILFFLPANMMKNVYWGERKIVERQLGNDTLQNLEKKSSEWFNWVVVDTGALRQSYALCERKSEDSFKDAGFGELVAGRLDVFWLCIKHMFFRFGMLQLWFPCALALFPTLIIDAYLQRKIRQNQFSSSGTLLHHSTGVSITMIAMIVTVTPLLPITMGPLYVPIGLAACGFAAWLWLAMYQKRS